MTGDLSPPFIKNVDHVDTASTLEPTKIFISGNWPTPNWEYEKTEIDHDNSTNTVTISYLGKRKGGMALQVLKPIKVHISVEFPKSGRWKILVIGRGQKVESFIDIKE